MDLANFFRSRDLDYTYADNDSANRRLKTTETKASFIPSRVLMQFEFVAIKSATSL